MEHFADQADTEAEQNNVSEEFETGVKGMEKDNYEGKQQPSSDEVESGDSPPAVIPVVFHDARREDLRQRQEQLAIREAALQERERNMATRRHSLTQPLLYDQPPNNFPPLLIICPRPFQPWTRIRMKREIPPPEKWKIQALLGMLIYTWMCFILNFIISLVGCFTIYLKVDFIGVGTIQYLVTMVIAFGSVIFCSFYSLCCWFLPLYGPYRKKQDSSLSLCWFFFFMLPQILIYIINGIGIPYLGACGFFNGSKFFNGVNAGAYTVGVLFLIMGFLWFIGAALATFVFFLMVKVMVNSMKQQRRDRMYAS